MRTVLYTASLITALLHSGLAVGDIYKYVSPDGRVFYTDVPDHSRYKLIVRTVHARPRTPKGVPRLDEKRNRYAPLIESVAERHSLDPNLLHAVIRAESGYNPSAISRKGAVGLMQLMPDTARRYGVYNPRDPDQNVEGGARYLHDLLGLFNSDLRLAVAAYNAGEGAVMKYNNTVPPYPETQQYVKRVLEFYRGYGKL